MLRKIAVLISYLLLPMTSHALQLQWASGDSHLSFAQATRCTLFVTASPGESALPREWRLLWTATNCTVAPLPGTEAENCQSDVADVTNLSEPVTRADSSAGLWTAQLCAASGASAARARYVLDLPAGGSGKLKAVALDPTDPESTRVLESNIATFNGVIMASLPVAALRATSIHQSLQMKVAIIGSNLDEARGLSITANDSMWVLPLRITERSGQRLVATASVAAVMPACQVEVASSVGSVQAPLSADPEPEMLIPESGACSAQYFEELLTPPPSPLGYTIQPKDFSFTAGFVDAATNRLALHLFYIRHNYWYYQPPNDQTKWHPELDEKNLGHAWTSDFVSWHGPAAGDKPDTTGIRVRSGKFDASHVWAPAIVHPPGPTFYMFYTGEGTDGHQRIGVATSTDLNTWTQSDNPVLTAPDVLWVKKYPDVKYNGLQQLRDPFVMQDPSAQGHWLMYFVAVDSLTGSNEYMAVGAARSTDLIHWSPLSRPFAATERATFQGVTRVVESPHVFKRNGQWWMPYTVNGDQVFIEMNPVTSLRDTFPTDTDPNHWTGPVWLRGLTQGRPAELSYWHATEHLGEPPTEWLAAFDDNAISIDIKGVFPTDSVGVDSLLLDCPPKPPVAGLDDPHRAPGQLRLLVLRPNFEASAVIRMELPWPTTARLAVYDIAGRRLTTLLDQRLPAGVTEVRWNGEDDSGNRIPSSVYFVRLICDRGARLSKVVMLR